MQVQIVEKPLKYGSRQYGIGQIVEMMDKHARLFMAIGRVGLPKGPRPDIPASPSMPITLVDEEGNTAPAERSRRQYRRRDMKVEG